MKKEYNELKNYLEKCSKSYYQDSKSIISDFEYDMKLKELEKLEDQLEIPLLERFSYKVGNDLTKNGSKVKHSSPMLSLANTYDTNDVSKWFNDIGGREVIIETKIDGASFTATYENGKLVKCCTRGDGEYGESILENAIFIKSLKISKNWSGEIRGELVFSKEGFTELNKNKQFANPRNALSGSIKLLDSNLFRERADAILAIAYWVQGNENKTQIEDLELIKSLGLKTPEYYSASNIEEIMNYINKIGNSSQDFEYVIDGAVLKVNDKTVWNQIGYTSHNPKFATCFKYKQEAVKTKINDITIQIGRTGKATAVAELEPVEIDGTVVSRVTLNNPEYIKTNDIRINDYVDVIKSACIIPLITKVYKDERDENSVKYKYPKNCPCCGSKLEKLNPEHADVYCTNNNCSARTVDKIINFCNNLNILGFAEIVVQKLFDNDIVRSISDLFSLKDHKEEFCKLERFGEKQFQNLCDEIEKSKSNPLEKIISSLGIPNVALKTAKNLKKKFLSLKVLEGATIEELEETEDIGELTAKSIYNWFRNTENKKLIKLLETEGYILSEESSEEKPTIDLTGKTFCITGALSLKRETYVDLIETCGGKVVGSVSSKLSYLITNDKTTGTTKNIKAKELGIPILNEKELLHLCDALTLLKELS